MWAKVDDKLFSHPKVAQCSQSAMGLWVKALSWSVCYSRDGIVPKKTVAHLGGKARDYRQLVDAGLWEETDGGFRFHDWDDYLPTEWESRMAKKDAEKDPSRVKGGKASRTSSGPIQDRVRTETGQSQDKVRTDSGLSQAELCPDFSRHDEVSPPKTSAEPQLNLSPVPSRPVPVTPNGVTHSDPDDDQAALIPVAAGGKPPDRPSKPRRFDEFWQAYPRHTNRKVASDRYESQVKDGAGEQQLIDAAVAFAAACKHNGTEQRFIPHASTWLNQQRWRETPEVIGIHDPNRTNTNGLTDQQWQAAYQRAVTRDSKESQL